jgi:predicted ATP-dependent Lon-type protease
MRPEFFTNQYGLIVNYLAEWMQEMRKRNFGDPRHQDLEQYQGTIATSR